MILWTIQSPEVYNLIQTQGYYICDETKSDCIQKMDFQKSYDWLVERMKEKIGQPPLTVKYPVWAYHTYDWLRKKPDLRYAGFGTPKEKLVCMEIEIPDEDVVLSDFDSWHFVLNNWYHGSKNEDEWEKIHTWLDSLPSDEKQKEIEKSWMNIFDISKIDTNWIQQGRFIQATFWKLSKSQIRKVQFFTAR